MVVIEDEAVLREETLTITSPAFESMAVRRQLCSDFNGLARLPSTTATTLESLPASKALKMRLKSRIHTCLHPASFL